MLFKVFLVLLVCCVNGELLQLNAKNLAKQLQENYPIVVLYYG
jgi:hypothetical protein